MSGLLNKLSIWTPATRLSSSKSFASVTFDDDGLNPWTSSRRKSPNTIHPSTNKFLLQATKSNFFSYLCHHLFERTTALNYVSTLSRTLSVALLPFFLSNVLAQDPIKPLRTSVAPVIDGSLDDHVWQDAPWVSGFKTFIPDFGKEMPESTHVLTAYDSENLYFAFRCFDPDPSTIKAEITSRDNIRPNDWVCINLDSFNDQQSLYGFYVNPLGIQADSRFAAGGEDHSVDYIWYSAGKVNNDGYTIEIQIPLKSIRYADKNPVEMGVIFERRVARRSEQATSPPLDPKRGYAFLTQMKPIQYHDLEYYTLFELLPAATYGQRYSAQSGKLSRENERGDLSLTAKYGITSDLILDATYNPDFSQIEADAGQVDVNLRAGLFFAEKRPFFLEGNEIFNIAGAGAFGANPLQAAVHTRTIINPLLGLKLSGKLGAKSTLATIYSVDELLDARSNPTGQRAHFPIVRYKHTLTDDSYIGGIYTGREYENRFNRVGGSDGTMRVTNSSFIEYHALFSQTKQTDSSSTLSGLAATVTYRYGTRDLDYGIGASKVSQNFSTEAGYLIRTGISAFSAIVRPKFYPASDILRRIDLEISSTQTRDDFSKLWETSNAASLSHVFLRGLNFRVRYAYATEVFLNQRFRRNGFLVSGGGQVTREINLTLQYRNEKAIFFSAAPYQGQSSRATASLTYQPWNQLELNSSITYVDFYRESDGQKIYEYPLARTRLTYQMNKYLFLRGVLEYNKFRRTLLSDFLASFTYIPGTVVHVGYGSLYQRIKWDTTAYVNADQFLETRRGFFLKMSYLWRM